MALIGDSLLGCPFFASQLDLPSWRFVGGLQQFCFLFFILASYLLFSFLKSGSHIAHEVEEKANADET